MFLNFFYDNPIKIFLSKPKNFNDLSFCWFFGKCVQFPLPFKKSNQMMDIFPLEQSLFIFEINLTKKQASKVIEIP